MIWVYVSCVLVVALVACFMFFFDQQDKLKNRANLKIEEIKEDINKLNNVIRKKDNIIKSLEDNIQQISTEDGISPEYRAIMDNLERHQIKDKEQITTYKRELVDCRELIDTFKSDIIALKAKPRMRSNTLIVDYPEKPSVNSDIQLREIPKRALIQAIYYIERSSIKLKNVSLKLIVETLGYEVKIVNCRQVGSFLRNMHFKLKDSRDGIVLMLDNNQNRKKLDGLYRKHCEDKT